jgi:hypothetical protein
MRKLYYVESDLYEYGVYESLKEAKEKQKEVQKKYIKKNMVKIRVEEVEQNEDN